MVIYDRDEPIRATTHESLGVPNSFLLVELLMKVSMQIYSTRISRGIRAYTSQCHPLYTNMFSHPFDL